MRKNPRRPLGFLTLAIVTAVASMSAGCGSGSGKQSESVEVPPVNQPPSPDLHLQSKQNTADSYDFSIYVDTNTTHCWNMVVAQIMTDVPIGCSPPRFNVQFKLSEVNPNGSTSPSTLYMDAMGGFRPLPGKRYILHADFSIPSSCSGAKAALQISGVSSGDATCK